MPFHRNLVPHDHAILQIDYMNDMSQLYNDSNLSSPIEVTFQVTERCNLACTYCYQIAKTPAVMSLDVAKAGVDMVLSDVDYIDSKNRIAVNLDFIGGEPLLEIDLIKDIYEYFLKKAYELNHPWAYRHRVSFCSNGILFMNENVQSFLRKYKQTVSVAITIDGPEILHDMCRKFPDGRPSHAIVEKSMKCAIEEYDVRSTKMTISPENVQYVGSMIKYAYEELHLSSIFINCTFEGPWSIESSRILYNGFIRIADYCYEHDTYSNLAISFFVEDDFIMNDYSEDDKNWCGGNGSMLAIAPDGKCYPCIRYMPSSVGNDVTPLVIGDVYNGLVNRPCEKCVVATLKSMTATSQSTQECIDCPINRGCAWCSGYNYQKFGKLNKRSTEICSVHKARALANVYYWNKFYEKHKIECVFENYLPEDESIRIIGKEAYDELVNVIEMQRSRVK